MKLMLGLMLVLSLGLVGCSVPAQNTPNVVDVDQTVKNIRITKHEPTNCKYVADCCQQGYDEARLCAKKHGGNVLVLDGVAPFFYFNDVHSMICGRAFRCAK